MKTEVHNCPYCNAEMSVWIVGRRKYANHPDSREHSCPLDLMMIELKEWQETITTTEAVDTWLEELNK